MYSNTRITNTHIQVDTDSNTHVNTDGTNGFILSPSLADLDEGPFMGSAHTYAG